MAASNRARKPKNTAAPGLTAALAFVTQAQKKDGEPWQSHCRIENGWLTGFNGTFAAGHKIDDDLSAAPNTATMAAAIAKCGDGMAITQLDARALSVRSGRFRATVPCLPLAEVPNVEPDPVCAKIDDRLKAGFALMTPMLEDSAERAIQAAVLLQANTMVGTNGFMLIESWHGIDLPPNLMIPRASAVAISKVDKKLSGFGFSANSVTFVYEDGSWLKTQLFDSKYPDYLAQFPDNCNYWPIPEDFFVGIKTLEPFSKSNMPVVKFSEEGMTVFAKDGKTESGSFEVEGLPKDRKFNIAFLKLAFPVLHRVDFETNRERLFFISEDRMTRGVIASIR